MATNVTALMQGDPKADMVRILDRQRAAFMAELPVPAHIRKDRLARAIALLVDHKDRIAQALSADFGHRSRPMSLLTDVAGSLGALRYAHKHVDAWMRAQKRKPTFPLGWLGAKASVEYQPKGVVGLLAPWNFPVQMIFAPLASILAAGNRVMIKPSEFTPATSQLMKDLFTSLFDETEAAVFLGGPEVGQAFTSLAFDHMIFTGATSIGRHVMRAAAENLTPVTLELGGKSPVIVSRSADKTQMAQRVITGKMMNSGQICLAPDYILAPQEEADSLTQAFVHAAKQLYPTLLKNPDHTSIINARHKERLEGYIADATAQGAQAIVVNPANEDFSNQSGTHKMPLALLRGVHDQMKVMQEEIFGPILPIMTYRNLDEAIDYVNAHPRPLGLYYFGSDAEEQRRVLERTISGGVTLNDVVFHVAQEDLPFGGIGASGMGAYHGLDGFKTFSHAKAIYKQTRFDVAKLAGLKPPYGKALEKTLAREIRK